VLSERDFESIDIFADVNIRFVHTGCIELRCRTAPHRNASGVNEPLAPTIFWSRDCCTALQEKELGNHSIAQLDVNASPVSEYHLPAQLKLSPQGADHRF